METGQSQTIRRTVALTVIAPILAWLGPLLGGDPVNPGPGFLIWGTAPLVGCLLLRSIADPLISGFLTPTPGLEFLGPFGVDGLIMILLFGGPGLGLLKARRRTRRTTATYAR